MAKAKYILDAQGTPGDDPSKMVRIYWDGTIQPASLPELTGTGWDRIEALPGWAEWDTAQAVAYIQSNVTNLESAKAVLIAMTKLMIAMRDTMMSHLDKERE